MKLTKKLEAEILKAYNEYWDAYLKGDMRIMSYWMHDNIQMIGSGRGEFFENKKATIKYYKATAKQVAGKADMRNRKISVLPVGDEILVNEECDFFVLIGSVRTFYGEGRISTLFTKTNKGWKIIQEHGSMPDARTTGGEQVNTNKIKAENIRLKEAVKRRTVELEEKNQELKIETALERVRAVAMGMKKPEDMLVICKTISKQLSSLGIKEIRNVQTAIFYKQRGSYMNYQYYARHNKTFITDTIYSGHKIGRDFASQMLKGKGKFYITHIKGRKKLKDWIAYQRSTKVFIDKYLYNAPSLSYYWYSLGPVALGISTYFPLIKKEENLFKRFVNVFELAYRRYLDIELAIEQAKEVQIELALERVRARTMAMQKSDELPETTFLLFQQLKELGETAAQLSIGIVKEETGFVELSATVHGNTMPQTYLIPADEPFMMKKAVKAWKEKKKSLIIEVKGKELKDYNKWRNSVLKKKIVFPEKQWIVNLVFFSKGMLSFSSDKEISKETFQLLERFAGVFDGTYTRFLDLQKAEAQAREAEIELALERVRARAMAMQKSDELLEASDTMFDELHKLKVETIRVGIGIIDLNKKEVEIWSRFQKSKHIEDKVRGVVPANVSRVFDNIIKAKKEKTSYTVLTLLDDDVKKHYQSLSKYLSYQPQTKYNNQENFYSFFFSEGALNVVSHQSLADEECKIMLRFAKVFGQMYTRFIDLQKAEAQARESQIQLALERVRARTMAMQHSNELQEVVNNVYERLYELEVEMDGAAICTFIEGSKDYNVWIGGLPEPLLIKFNDLTQVQRDYNEVIERRDELFTKTYSGKIKKEYIRFLLEGTVLRSTLPEDQKQVLLASDFFTTVIACTKNTAFQLYRYSGKSFQEEETDILKRFAKVFEQAYTRFLDLQKAEAQAREAQIELSLERVRARAMAMQKSEELSELVDTVFKELTRLDFALNWCIINIIDESSLSNTVWAANPDIDKAPESYYMKFEDYPFHHAMMKGYQERRTKYVYVLKGQEKKIYDEYLFNETEFRKVPTAAQAASRAMEKYVVTFSFSNFGGLQTVGDVPLSDANLEILSRFGRVFDLTYTRFNDLQKAEAQAREAQIEASLERIRSRTMGMQKSNDLRDVAALLSKELVSLGIADFATCGYVEIEEKNHRQRTWLTNQDGIALESFYLPLTGEHIFNERYDAWKRKDTLFRQVVHKKELNTHLDFAYSSGFGSRESEDVGRNFFPDPTIFYNCNFSHGYLSLVTGTMLSQEQELLMARFTKVFEQTYSRFLDLQKAEAQAREAEIELSLERVRSKAMAMHSSSDILSTTTTAFEELKKLGIHSIRCGIGLLSKNSMEAQVYASTTDSNGVFQTLVGIRDMNDHPSLTRQYQSWLKQENFAEALHDEELKSYYNKLFFNSSATSAIPQSFENKQFGYYFSFADGLFYSWSDREYTENEINILTRFKTIVALTFRRFLDLQKAEAQAREARIETALEKVRSRSMGMQKSEELKEVIQVVYDQFVHLNINVEHTGFIMDYKARDDMHIWLADQHEVPSEVFIPYFDSAHWNSFNEAKEKGTDFFPTLLDFEEKNKFYKDLFALIPGVPQETLEYYFNCPGLAGSTVLLDNVSLYIENFQGIPYTDEENNILMRFGKVFQQTYTRFLDLKKAEAQAREAKIEAALEKVRSRSLAMHNPDELKEVVNVVFEKLVELNIVKDGAAVIFVFKEGSNVIEQWTAAPGLLGSISHFYIPYFDHPIQKEFLEAKEKGVEFFTKTISFEEKNRMFKWLFEYSDYKYFRDETKKWLLECESFTRSDAIAKNSSIFIPSYTRQLLSENEIDTLKRFSRVFEQAYVRFLDLQKAEAQTREAQIEASLERVRSRTMAMHKSEELADTAAHLFAQLNELGIHPYRCNIAIVNTEKKNFQLWSTTNKGEVISAGTFIPLAEHPFFKKMYDEWKRKESISVVRLVGDDRVSFTKYITQFVSFAEYRPEQINIEQILQEVAIFSNFFFKQGFIAIHTTEELSEPDLNIIRRFTNVFEQTYTRFLDLQKAEAQTREAKIEAAMEKVRARAMAMQKPDELVEVAQVLRKEMGLLGVEELETSSIYIYHEETGKTECWYAIQDKEEKRLVADHMVIDLNDTWVGREMLAFYRSDEKQISIPMKGENRKEWINYCSQHSKLLQGFYGELIPERTYHLYKFSNGYMGAASPGDISTESWNLLQRATSVFSLAYTRFSDLQIAEASTKEVIKQAALDRIRADIASMRTISDLDRITPLIWNELTILGIPFIRCGVFIMDESQQLIHTFLSTPDGKAIAAFHLPYDTPGNIRNVINNWHDKKNYLDHWDEDAFTQFADILVKQGALVSAEQYLKTIPKGGFYLHFLPFLQGMLYVGNTTQLHEEEINLIQSVADAFSTAYARYEDFNKLEAAKQQVDKTLVDLKQAQQQLVQSEKMASLGELTAGIAHEIQNPLNFVNNFSEVSKELLDEMKEELDKGNTVDAKEIADDVIQNLEKVNHHGKRADAIVKGMLQHSRSSSGVKEPTDINALCDEYLRLSYHGLRAKDKSFNAKFETDFDPSLEKINIIPQDIGRVILNLLTNAFYAASLPSKGGFSESDSSKTPTVWISTKKEGNKILISVRDNGPGIPQKVLDKIFQPFFTTKPTGQGTGLGLSLSYDIIKAHGGEIKVETKEGEGTTFIIWLPV